MKSNYRTAVLAGVAGGYVLGRTRKGKLAFVVTSLLVGRRLRLGPQDLIRKCAEKASEIPQFAELGDQVRGDLMAAARTAVTTTVNRRIDRMSDSLHERTESFAQAAQGNRRERGEGEDEEGASRGDGEDADYQGGREGEPAPCSGHAEKRPHEKQAPEKQAPEKRATRREHARSAGSSRR